MLDTIEMCLTVTMASQIQAQRWYEANTMIQDKLVVLVPVSIYGRDLAVYVDVKAKRPNHRRLKKQLKRVAEAISDLGHKVWPNSGYQQGCEPSFE